MRFHITLTALFALTVSVLLPACAYRLPEAQVAAESDQITLRLAEAADRAAQSLETLAAIEHQREPVAIAPLADAVPAELRRSITVNWTGGIEPLAETLANRIGYNFKTAGNKPEVPVIVSIDARSEPAVNVLRDIGYQMGKRGDIVLNGQTQTVEVVYATSDPSY